MSSSAAAAAARRAPALHFAAPRRPLSILSVISRAPLGYLSATSRRPLGAFLSAAFQPYSLVPVRSVGARRPTARRGDRRGQRRAELLRWRRRRAAPPAARWPGAAAAERCLVRGRRGRPPGLGPGVVTVVCLCPLRYLRQGRAQKLGVGPPHAIGVANGCVRGTSVGARAPAVKPQAAPKPISQDLICCVFSPQKYNCRNR